MIRIDLHIHSVYSDGTCTVGQIADLAARRGVSVLALTDHDTIAGVPEFISACKRRSIRPLSGIELSAMNSFTAHILGYRFKDLNVVQSALDWVIERRDARNERICDRLVQSGVEITMDEVRAQSLGRVVARPHFANVLVNKGYVADRGEAFRKYLAKGGLAYVAREAYSPADCVRIIREAGGLPVFAHPSVSGLSHDEMESFLASLKAEGLWGLECLCCHCTMEESFEYLKMADRLGLQATAGSDFHGSNRPGVPLGVLVSENFLPWARLGIAL